MGDTLRFGVLQGHLDKPHGSLARWATATSCVPAAAFGRNFCFHALGSTAELGIGIGSFANVLIFNARCFSELLSRPQSDRMVLRRALSQRANSCDSKGEAQGARLVLINAALPEYSELDDLVEQKTVVEAK